MKRMMMTSVFCMLVSGWMALPARAHDMDMRNPAKMQQHVDDRMKKLTKELNLTSDQQASVRSAMQIKMEKMSAAEKDFDNSVRTVLNPEQMKKYDSMINKK